jgi:hypothetical protein
MTIIILSSRQSAATRDLKHTLKPTEYEKRNKNEKAKELFKVYG